MYSFGETSVIPPPAGTVQSSTGSTSKTGKIYGLVLGADTESGLRKATATLYAEGFSWRMHPLAAKTNANGEYQLDQIKPGRYLLIADRNGYLRQVYGGRLAARTLIGGMVSGKAPQGTPLEVRAGETLGPINFRLIRGAVIEGQIFDEDNEPLSRVEIQLSQYRTVAGKRKLIPSSLTLTDNRGYYRLFDVSPGKYYLSANYRSFGTPGVPAEAGPQTAYPLVYYPGVLNLQAAARIEVPPGGEIGGINFTMEEAVSFRAGGRVLTADGSPASEIQVISTKVSTIPGDDPGAEGSARTDRQGDFQIMNLFPGRYRVLAGTRQEGRVKTASTIIDLGSDNLSGITLVLGDGTEMSGRISLEDQPNTAALQQIRLVVIPERELFGDMRAEIHKDATFHVVNIPEGMSDIRVELPPGSFYVKSIRMAEREVVDEAVEFKKNDRISGVEVVISSRGAELNGVVRTGEGGELVKGATVVLFSAEPGHRRANSRFTKTTQTDQEGHFSLKGIVPAEYCVCALTNYETGSESDAEYLKEIEKLAKPIKLLSSEPHNEALIAVPAPGAE